MGYIKLIDPYYSWKKGDHISQRWAMGMKFPKYDDYKLFCGDAEKTALQIKKMRDEGKGDLVKSYKFLPRFIVRCLKDNLLYHKLQGQRGGSVVKESKQG